MYLEQRSRSNFTKKISGPYHLLQQHLSRVLDRPGTHLQAIYAKGVYMAQTYFRDPLAKYLEPHHYY